MKVSAEVAGAIVVGIGAEFARRLGISDKVREVMMMKMQQGIDSFKCKLQTGDHRGEKATLAKQYQLKRSRFINEIKRKAVKQLSKMFFKSSMDFP